MLTNTKKHYEPPPPPPTPFSPPPRRGAGLGVVAAGSGGSEDFITTRRTVVMNDFILPLLHKELSASTRDWTDQEFGAYVRLLIAQWDQGSIPEDITRLRKIADSIDQTKDVVLPKFKPCDEPRRLKNLKMEQVREERKVFREKKSKAGKIGMKSRYQKSNKPSNKQPNKTLTFIKEVEVEDKVNSEKENGNEIPPGRSVAQEYFKSVKPDHWTDEHLQAEVGAWFDHYSAVGWKVGKNKMKDWRAAVRTWIRNDFNYQKQNNGTNRKNGTDKKLTSATDYSNGRKPFGKLID